MNRRKVKWSLLGLLILVLGIVLISSLERLFIYYPERGFIITPESLGLAYEDVWLEAEDGVKLHGWLLPGADSESVGDSAADAPVVLFLHGNAGNVSYFLEKAAGLVRRGLTVFMPDYRGYGRSGGSPSEQGLFRDARAAYDWLLSRSGGNPERLVVWGYSLGGAAAVDLAAGRPARALILESTFTSVPDLAATLMPFVLRFLAPSVYLSESKLNRFHLPLLVVHGDADELVPVEMGRRLYEVYTGPKRIFIVPGAGHTDVELVGGSEYYQVLDDFIRRPQGGSVD